MVNVHLNELELLPMPKNWESYLHKFNANRIIHNLKPIEIKIKHLREYIKKYSSNDWDKFAEKIDTNRGIGLIKKEIKHNTAVKHRLFLAEHQKSKWIKQQEEISKAKPLEIKALKSIEKKRLVLGKTSIKNGFVYIITNPIFLGWVKIGNSIDLNARLSSYQICDPFQGYKIEHSIYFDDRIDAENQIHIALDKFRGKGEWFKLDISSAIRILNNISYQITQKIQK